MSKRSNIQEDERTYGRKRYIDPLPARDKMFLNGQRKKPTKRASKARAKHYLSN